MTAAGDSYDSRDRHHKSFGRCEPKMFREPHDLKIFPGQLGRRIRK